MKIIRLTDQVSRLSILINASRIVLVRDFGAYRIIICNTGAGITQLEIAEEVSEILKKIED